jgi:hypothetical protein
MNVVENYVSFILYVILSTTSLIKDLDKKSDRNGIIHPLPLNLIIITRKSLPSKARKSKFLFLCRLLKGSVNSFIQDHHERHKNNISII